MVQSSGIYDEGENEEGKIGKLSKKRCEVEGCAGDGCTTDRKRFFQNRILTTDPPDAVTTF